MTTKFPAHLYVSFLRFQIENGTNAVFIAVIVMEQLYFEPITSGGLLTMPKILQNLTDLHISQLNNDENSNYTNWNYTKHTFHIVDELLRQEISWKVLLHLLFTPKKVTPKSLLRA